jgi:hypothetical protein
MIERNEKTGRRYCSGKYCGYPLSWHSIPAEDREAEGADGLWVCLDCGDAMYAGAETRAE